MRRFIHLPESIRGHLANASYGAADYLVQPILMLLSTPFLLHRLGVAPYGLWILACAAVSSGNLISSGFGDAAIKYISACRGCGDWPGAHRIVRCMIAINLILSSLVAAVVWGVAPYLVRHIVPADTALQLAGRHALRIGCILLIAKSLESVFISSLRALLHYGPAFKIASVTRTATLLVAVALTADGRGIVAILYATLCIAVLGVAAQALTLRFYLDHLVLLPLWERSTMAAIAGFGCFSWLQAIAGVTSIQADRLLVGFFLGAPALAYYSVCTQAAQPIHGLISSGFHFLFPHLSARTAEAPAHSLRHTIAIALSINIFLAALFSAPLIFFSHPLLRMWMGAAFADHASLTLSLIACSFALLSLNITAHYALLALGEVKLVSWVNVLAALSMLSLMAVLTPRWEIQGAAMARLLYGPVTFILYLYLYRILGYAKPVEVPVLAVHAIPGNS